MLRGTAENLWTESAKKKWEGQDKVEEVGKEKETGCSDLYARLDTKKGLKDLYQLA